MFAPNDVTCGQPAKRELPSLSLVRRELCRRSLAHFSRAAWPILEPSAPLVWNWHIDAKCQHLEAVTDGRIRRLRIHEPPGHGKSLWCNVFWPAWMWANRPQWRWLLTSYADTLVDRDALKFRTLIESDWYKGICREPITLDKVREDWISNTHTGVRRTTTVQGRATGERADGIIIDDALNATDSRSKSALEQCRFWYDQAIANRLSDMRTGFIVMICQRLCDGDLPAHVEHQENWVVLKLPTLFDPDDRCTTPIGWSDPRTQKDELLFAERFPSEVIAREKYRLGSYGFAAQHQQDPAPSGGGKFQSRCFRYFERGEGFYILHRPEGDKRVLANKCWRFQTIDLALTENEKSDYTVIGTWDITPDNEALLIDIERFRAEAPKVKEALILARHRWQPIYQAIERAHYGIEVCQEWARAGMPFRPLSAHKEKAVRSVQAELMVENGRMYFLQGATWLADYEDELKRFDSGEHDDQVDVTSYAAIEVARHSPGSISIPGAEPEGPSCPEVEVAGNEMVTSGF